MSAGQPIVAGFYPDPSICRAGDTYYLVNSSFGYLPGLPLHASTDLVTWTPIGNALTRASQIAELPPGVHAGVYAPTIRHHDDQFFIVTTSLADISSGLGHFIITADNPAGPWSDPVYTPGAVGIDPDLAWDEDGVCHLTWASVNPNQSGIVSVPLDPATGELLGTPTLLWQGTGGAHPEGPHLYRIHGWWYLLLAEGGTERGHMSTIARTRSLEEPFHPAPNNPILTHRGTAHPVQNVGHADLVELADGTWAAVHLGVRARGQTPAFHVNGRETFLVGVDWVDGWPVVDEQRFPVDAADHSYIDRFDTGSLDPRWLAAATFPTAFTRHQHPSGLIIDTDSEAPGQTLLAARTRDPYWSAEAQFDVANGAGRFAVWMDDHHWYGLNYDGSTVEAVLAIGPVVHTVTRISATDGTTPTLRLTAHPGPALPYIGSVEPDMIELAVVDADGTPTVLGAYDGRYLSTEVAGGFLGRVLAVQALAGEIIVRSVRYTTEQGKPRTPEADR